MLQGFASSLFYWDREQHSFFVKHGIFVSHLSQTSLSSILNQFLFIGTCLKKVEIFTKKVKASNQRAPTLEAFTDSVFLWLKVFILLYIFFFLSLNSSILLIIFLILISCSLVEKRLRDVALTEEKFAGSDSGTTITLQGLTDSLSRYFCWNSQ